MTPISTELTGFTVIELVIVMVIISLLAIVAIPRFIDQTTVAQQNSTNSLAGALSAISAENFAKRNANASVGTAITNCTNFSNLLQSGLPSGYTISAQPISPGASVSCILTGNGNTVAIFIGSGIA